MYKKEMKTRLRANKEKTSFELTVLNGNECQIYYFTNKDKAINYQKKITKK